MNHNKIGACLAVICCAAAISYYAWTNNADAAMWASFALFSIVLLTISNDQHDKTKARVKLLEGDLKHMTWCAEYYNKKMHEAEAKLK